MTVRESLELALQRLDEGRPSRAEDHILMALGKLDASQPQCLDDPPLCSHRLVPDRQVVE